MPPGREARLHFSSENDFLGRGGEFDDQRTQQLSLELRVGERWHVVGDHSILTNHGPNRHAPDPPGLEGRLDEWSLSLARRWDHRVGRVLLGVGLRGVGKLGGARVQNGFHRLFGSDIVDLRYLEERRTDPIGWLAWDREDLRPLGERGWKGGWWLRAAGQFAGRGRADANVAALGLLRRRVFELRTGLRADWREGSNRNIVESAVAASERGLFGVIGLGLGPLELESSHRVDGGSAYGRAVWRAGPPTAGMATPSGRYLLHLGLRLPDTAWRVGASWSPTTLARVGPGDLRGAVAVGYVEGKSPVGESVNRFRVEQQLTGGLALRGAARGGWLSPLAELGFGWRREVLDGAGLLAGTQSEAVDRATIAGELGADMRMTELPGHGSLALRIALTGRLPLGDATVAFAGQTHRLQRPGGGFAISIAYAAGP